MDAISKDEFLYTRLSRIDRSFDHRSKGTTHRSNVENRALLSLSNRIPKLFLIAGWKILVVRVNTTRTGDHRRQDFGLSTPPNGKHFVFLLWSDSSHGRSSWYSSDTWESMFRPIQTGWSVCIYVCVYVCVCVLFDRRSGQQSDPRSPEFTSRFHDSTVALLLIFLFEGEGGCSPRLAPRGYTMDVERRTKGFWKEHAHV